VLIDIHIFVLPISGGQNYDAAVAFLKERFLEQNKTQGKRIHVHVTCATDTSNMKVVFDSVHSSVFDQNLRMSGFI
jgi:guanine nucleotide-binding protein G(i) subunit alpha